VRITDFPLHSCMSWTLMFMEEYYRDPKKLPNHVFEKVATLSSTDIR